MCVAFYSATRSSFQNSVLHCVSRGTTKSSPYSFKLLWEMRSGPLTRWRLHEILQRALSQGETGMRTNLQPGLCSPRSAHRVRKCKTFIVRSCKGAVSTSWTTHPLNIPAPPLLPLLPQGPPSHPMTGCPAGSGHTSRALRRRDHWLLL